MQSGTAIALGVGGLVVVGGGVALALSIRKSARQVGADSIYGAAAALAPALAPALGSIGKGVQGLGQGVGGAVEKLGGGVGGAVGAIGGGVGGAVGAIGGGVGKVVGGVGSVVGGVGTAVQTSATGIARGIGQIQSAVGAVGTGGKRLVSDVYGGAKSAVGFALDPRKQAGAVVSTIKKLKFW